MIMKRIVEWFSSEDNKTERKTESQTQTSVQTEKAAAKTNAAVTTETSRIQQTEAPPVHPPVQKTAVRREETIDSFGGADAATEAAANETADDSEETAAAATPGSNASTEVVDKQSGHQEVTPANLDHAALMEAVQQQMLALKKPEVPIVKHVQAIDYDPDSNGKPINPALGRTSGRRVLLAYEVKHSDGRSIIKLVVSNDHGLTWGEPQILFSPKVWPYEGVSFTRPLLQPDQVTGRVFVTASVHLSDQPGDIRIGMAFSDDQGDTFRHRDVTTLINGDQGWLSRATIPGHGLQLRNGIWTGRLVQPAVVVDADNISKAVVVCSDDQGISWWAGRAVGKDVAAAGITELEDGRIVLTYQAEQAPEPDQPGHLPNPNAPRKVGYYSVVSLDGGRSFTKPIDLIGSADEICVNLERAFVSAPAGVAQGKVQLLIRYGDKTTQTQIHVSQDEGESWTDHLDIATGEVRKADLVSLEDVRLCLAAYQNDKGIGVSVIRLDDLGLGEMASGWNASKQEQDALLENLGLLN